MKKEAIVQAIIGGIFLLLSTIISGYFASTPVRISIQATQTAEAKLLFTPTVASVIGTPSSINTPLPNASMQPSSTQSSSDKITFNLNSFLMALSGAIIVFIYSMALKFYTKQVDESNNQFRAKYSSIASVMISLLVVSPFVLIWLRYFFSIPYSLSLATVLLVALSTASAVLWFEESLARHIRSSEIKAVLVFFSTYVTAFGFTNWNWEQSFFNSTIIIACVITYVFLIFILDTLVKR